MTVAETFLTLVLLLLSVVVAAWVGLYVYTAQSKRRYVAQAMLVTQQLECADDDLSVIEQIAGQSSPDAPLPYGPLARDLRLRLQRARESHANCAAQLAELRQTEYPQPPGATDRLLSFLWSQPRAWRQHAQAVETLSQQIVTMQKQVAGAQQQAEQMRTLPLGVAGRVRSILSASERVTRVCQALQQAGVRGDGLDALIAAARTHSRAIESVPDYFRQATNDVVLASASPESTRDAWQKLSNVEKPVYDALRRAQQWQEVYGEARNMVGAIQVESAVAERILRELPPFIDASRHAAEFDGLQAGAREIEAAWRSPEVNRLSDISNAATKQVMAFQQLAGNVMWLQKTHQGFEQAVASNDALIERIGAVIGALGGSEVCPVQWDHSAVEYERLRATHAAVSDMTLVRDATRLEVDLDNALDLGLQASTLEAHVNDTRNHHTQLLALLSSPEFETRDVWFHETAGAHVDAAVYAPANWPERDGITTLKPDATALLKREQDLQPLLVDQPLREDELQNWLDGAGAYLRERRALQSRLDSITKTLRSIERAERAAQTEITQALGALSRLDQGVTQALTAPLVVNAWNDVIDWWGDGKRLAESLEDRQAGKVSDKAAGMSAWAAQCAQCLRNLCQAVEAEAETARLGLTAQVEALVAIAPFDTEPSMATAQQLLNAVHAPARPIGAKAVRDVAGLVEQANAAYQRCVNTGDALADLQHRVVTQVEPRVTRLDEAHAAAWDKLQELQALQRQIPYIKPIAVVCDEAEQLIESFKQAEASLEDLGASGRTVKSVVSRLDSLIQQFQYIANQGAGAQADIERDLVRLRAAWDQVSQWMRQLKRYRDWQSNDRAVGEAIGERLADIEQRFTDMQRRYKGRPLPLEHACRELDALLSATRHDVEVPRENGSEVITAQTIQAV